MTTNLSLPSKRMNQATFLTSFKSSVRRNPASIRCRTHRCLRVQTCVSRMLWIALVARQSRFHFRKPLHGRSGWKCALSASSSPGRHGPSSLKEKWLAFSISRVSSTPSTTAVHMPVALFAKARLMKMNARSFVHGTTASSTSRLGLLSMASSASRLRRTKWMSVMA